MVPLPVYSHNPCSLQPNSLFLLTNKPRLHGFTKVTQVKNWEGRCGIKSLKKQIVTPPGLQHELMPKHVAVIMDGNRRWARSHGLMPVEGYLMGGRSLKVLIDLCLNWGIEVLTVFTFSSDNLLRPKVEVNLLMRLLESSLKEEIIYMLRQDIQLSIIGDSSKLPKSLQEVITYAENTTKNNSRLKLVLAINYSGKYDIIQACQSIALKVKEGVVKPEEINELMVENELGTSCMHLPHPDLLIRTSGELRVSNFYLWQLAYTELHFTKSHWPDFGEDEFLQALHAFQKRVRRYGR